MDESRYQSLAETAFRKIEDALRDVDADDVDCERAGDVITLTFKTKKRAIINTQRPTRQIWLAANARAWHFSYDDAKAQWFDDKDAALDLATALANVVREGAGIDVAF